MDSVLARLLSLNDTTCIIIIIIITVFSSSFFLTWSFILHPFLCFKCVLCVLILNFKPRRSTVLALFFSFRLMTFVALSWWIANSGRVVTIDAPFWTYCFLVTLSYHNVLCTSCSCHFFAPCYDYIQLADFYNNNMSSNTPFGLHAGYRTPTLRKWQVNDKERFQPREWIIV